MKILIKNALVLPMTNKESHVRGSIAIEDGKISAIGNIPPTFIADQVIDGSRMIALPGFVNAHTHASMQYFKNFNDTHQNLETWLQAVWKYEAILQPNDIKLASILAIAEMNRSGTTCFTDMYFDPEQTIEALIETHMKATIGLTLFGELAESKKRINSSLSYFKSIRNNYPLHLSFDIAPHAIYTCSGETYSYGKQIANEVGCRLHTHLSESPYEVEQSKKENGMSPIAYLDSLGALDDHTYLAHVVHPIDNDLEILQRTKPFIIHNPSSNCKLGNGIAPISTYKELGLSVALGTDGSSSNNTLDMFKEMRLCAMISATSTHNPIALTPFEIIRMATIDGATALGRDSVCGTLEVGKDADIVLIDIDKPHLSPLNDPYSAIVFGCNSADVDTVLIRGDIVYTNSEFSYIDIERYISEMGIKWEEIQNRVKD
jgi:5-methylthioadenosine/S-adenosylhomocysteine deaminase